MAQLVGEFCYAGAWVAPVPVIVLDARNIVFANAAALRRLDYVDADELIGKPIDRALHPDALPAELSRCEVVAHTRRPLLGVPTKLRSRTGEPRHEMASVFPVGTADSHLTLLALGTHEDGHSPGATRGGTPAVPDLGEFGGELGVAILEALAAPILIQDIDTILFANAAARGHLAASDRSQLEGRHIMSIIHPDGMLATIERVGFVFATRQKLTAVPLKLKTLDGRTIHAEGDAYPLKASGRWGVLVLGRFVRDGETAQRV